jgi:hypothetical protein
MPTFEFQPLVSEDEEQLFFVTIDGKEQDYFAVGVSYSVPNLKDGGSFTVFTVKFVDEESGGYYYMLNFNGWISPNLDDRYVDPIWIITPRKQGVVCRIPGRGRMDFPWPKSVEWIADSFVLPWPKAS